jgi:hypothetical protein
MVDAPHLFEHDLPPGLHYRDDFIAEADERVLLDAIAEIAFSDFEMRGVVAPRRRILRSIVVTLAPLRPRADGRRPAFLPPRVGQPRRQ